MRPVITENELWTRFPAVPWREPTVVQRPDLGLKRLGCRICIAQRGLSGPDVPALPATRAEFDQHMAEAHPRAEA